MSIAGLIAGGGSSERFAPPRRFSYNRLVIADSLAGFGLVTGAIGAGGLMVDRGDAVILLLVAAITAGLGFSGRRTFVQRHRPTPAHVVVGLASTWVVLVLVGMIVYLVTGSIDRVDDALFESASGFSTTALTTIRHDDISSTMHVWRAATQWMGGLVGIIAAVVALPSVIKGSVHVPREQGRRVERLVPNPEIGRRRVVALYSALTALCGLGYLITGLGVRDSVVHALTTLSTGGFSSRPDSLVSAGGATQAMATFFMTIAGMSYFVLWWAVRRQGRRFFGSAELRLYLAIIVGAATVLVFIVDDLSVGHALFNAASAASTTGYAVDDWTSFGSGALSILLVVVATGAMGAAAGGGLRVVRARVLVGFAHRELRRQLDPNSVTVLTNDGHAIDERELDRLTGYQIAHFAIWAVGAFLLTVVGVELVPALWSAISVLSTAGPAPGTGPFGDAGALGADGRLVLIPGMLVGRLTILPLLLTVVAALRAKDRFIRGVKRLARRVQ